MESLTHKSILLYRDTCIKCRILSYLVLLMSIGTVKRIPIDSEVARKLLKAHQLSASKAILVENGKVYHGTAMIIAVFKAIQHNVIKQSTG